MDAVTAVDMRWALRLQCDAADLRKPGLRVIRGRDLDQPVFMRYVVPFFALFPLHTPNSVTVISTDAVCEEILSWSINSDDLSAEALEPRLLELAEGMGHEDAYILNEVLQINPDSDDAVDWNGTPLSSMVDGDVFVVEDERGIAAWAGEKRTSDVARDIRVATREDRYRQGLARTVASHAIAAIVGRGITPYYSHLRGNVASTRLAQTLGFQPYGSAVLAAYQTG